MHILRSAWNALIAGLRRVMSLLGKNGSADWLYALVAMLLIAAVTIVIIGIYCMAR